MKTILRSFESLDAKRRLEIYDHEDGFYSYEEVYEAVEDIPDYGLETYWGISYVSGLFDSAEAAECDAKLGIPWLRSLPG